MLGTLVLGCRIRLESLGTRASMYCTWSPAPAWVLSLLRSLPGSSGSSQATRSFAAAWASMSAALTAAGSPPKSVSWPWGRMPGCGFPGATTLGVATVAPCTVVPRAMSCRLARALCPLLSVTRMAYSRPCCSSLAALSGSSPYFGVGDPELRATPIVRLFTVTLPRGR